MDKLKWILLLLLWLFPLRASGWHLDFGGSFKTLFSFEKLRQTQIFQKEQNFKEENRLRLQGALSSRNVRFEFANETFLFYKSPNASLFQLPDFSPPSAWKAEWILVRESQLEVLNRMDRAYVQWDFQDLQIRAGKQVVAIGVGQIFNAVSQMRRYPLIFLDPEFPKTEDAVSFIWAGPLQIEGRFLPKVPGQQKDNFHLRAKSGKEGWDLAFTAGRSDDKTFWGVESAGGLGEGVMRFELVGYNFERKDYAQGLLGWDYVFSADWSTKFELFYNGFGEETRNSFSPYPHRSAPFRGTWYLGQALSWEIHPLLKSHWVSVINLKDPSALLHLNFNYSLSNSWDLLVGSYLGIGKGSAEFGGTIPLGPGLSFGQPDIAYLALRCYF